MTDLQGLQQLQTHQRLIHKVCWIYSSNADDRKDLFQEILIQAWQSYSTYRGDSKFSTWLYRVALNTAMTWQKRSQRTSTASLPAIDLQDDSDQSEQREAQFQGMYRAIAQLNKIDKALVTLYFEEYSYHEIGETLGITANNVAVKMTRIKQLIKEYMSKEGTWN